MKRFRFFPMPNLEPFNLLEEHLYAEVHVVIPREGRAKLFCTKMDEADLPKVMRVTQAIVEAALDFAKLYGVEVRGQIGGPAPPGAPPSGDTP